MPSIAEATRARGGRERRRLAAGVALVLAGALFVGLGAAGTVSGTTPKTGLVVGSVAVVASLAALATGARLREHERALVAVGAAVATASVLFVLALAPAAVLTRPALTAPAGLGYLAGIAVMLAALLAGLTLPDGRRSRRADGGAVSWTRSGPDRTVREQAADGGTADDDLSFPLEDD